MATTSPVAPVICVISYEISKEKSLKLQFSQTQRNLQPISPCLNMGDSCPRVGVQRACDDELMRDVYHGMLDLETEKGSDIIAGVLKKGLGDASL